MTARRRYPAFEARGGGQEEPPRIQGQGQCPRTRAAAGRSNPMPKARAVTGRRNPTPKARGSSWEEQPHIQGVVAVWA